MEKRVLEKQISFCHFGHEHPLKHTNSPPRENSLCSACKLKISPGNNIKTTTKEYYTCKTNNCPFYLHNVCHNMPKKTQHPSHPSHHLTLQTSPPPLTLPSLEPLRCEACEGHINGYFYSCDECRLGYHILCSALPLSISVSCHTHELKLTFSPPYNFSCDICAKPSYNNAKGWLYRCQICEFDTHLACAIASRRAQSFPEALINGQTTRSSPQSSLRVRRISVDYCSEVDEVMQLFAEKLLVASKADSSWDFRLQSPKENLDHKTTVSSTTTKVSTRTVVGPINGQIEAKNIGVVSPNPGKPFLHHSPLTPLSEETSTVASFQFSEACFSIDLARSYSGSDQKNRGRTEVNDDDHDQSTKGGSNGRKAEGSKIDSNYSGNIAEKMIKPSDDLKQQKQGGYGNYGLGTYNCSFNMGRDERLKEAFLVRKDTLAREELGQIKGKKGKTSGTKGKSTTISHRGMSGGSTWQKLICFCYTT